MSSVRAIQFLNGREESKWIANDIKMRIANGLSANEIAVLARAAAHLDDIASEFRRGGIQFSIASTRGLLRQRSVLDALAFIRAALLKTDNNAWYQACTSRISQLPPEDLVHCIEHGRRKMIPLSHALFSQLPPELSADSRGSLKILAQKLSLSSEWMSAHKTSELVYQLLEQSGYFTSLTKEIETGSEAAADDLLSLNQFLEFTAGWETQHPAATPYEFLADCERLLEAGEECEREQENFSSDAVQLLTVHASKGLEFDTVYISSMVEGRFPGTERSDSIELPDGLLRDQIATNDFHIHEERRLAYVAFTRAKQNLILTCAEKYSSSENARVRKISRFISEAEIHCEIAVARQETTPGTVAQLPVSPHADLSNINYFLNHKNEFSFTQLKIFQKCPYQYWFAYVLKLPARAKWTMNFGRTMHITLERWYRLLSEAAGAQQISLFENKISTEKNEIPSVEKFLELFSFAWIPDGYPTRGFHDEQFEKGKAMLRAYHKKHESCWRAPTHMEQRFKVAIGGECIVGAIDRIDCRDDGAIEIIDYKTGEPKDSEKLSFDDKEQLLVYYLAAERVLRIHPKFLTYYYLQTNESVTFEPTEKDIEKIETRVAETVAEIKKGQFKASPSQHACRNCDYKDICPYRQL